MLPAAKEILALPPSPLDKSSARRSRQLLIASTIISLVVSFLTVAAFTRWSIKRDLSAALAEMSKNRRVDAGRNDATGANTQTVKVRVEVSQGRVTRSSIEEHRPGLEAYESLALRIARQRRYPATVNGQDTISVKINGPQ
jgi:hypothetical protein